MPLSAISLSSISSYLAPKISMTPARPCDRCRRRKTKCIFEESGRCYNCILSHEECEFNLPPLKKKKKTPEAPKSPRASNFTYYLEDNSEFDKYVFTALIPQQSIPLNSTNSVKRQITKHGPDIFLEIQSDSTQATTEIEDIVGETGPQLIDLYFRIVHSSFPILARDDAYSPCLLACLYLFALNWWAFDSDSTTETQIIQHKLEKLAEASFYEELKSPSLQTVQAGLLLIQHQSFHHRHTNPYECWPLQCALTSCAQVIGLDRNPDSWNIPKPQKSLRKRVWWALYIQEKWFSLTVDKVSLIREYSVPELTSADFDEIAPSSAAGAKVDSGVGRSLFVEKIRLTKIVDDILQRLNSIKGKEYLESLYHKEPLEATKETLEYVKPIQLRLKLWETNLPKVLTIELNVSRGFISGAANIYISSFTVHTAVLKPVLKVLCRAKESRVNEEFMNIRDIIFTKCIAIFDKVLQFMNQLKAEHLQTFWYTSARDGFSNIVIFGYLLAFISRDRAELDSCLDKMEDYVWKLKVNKKNADFLKHAALWWAQLKRNLNTSNMCYYDF